MTVAADGGRTTFGPFGELPWGVQFGTDPPEQQLLALGEIFPRSRSRLPLQEARIGSKVLASKGSYFFFEGFECHA